MNMNVGAKCWSRGKGGCAVPWEGKGKSGQGSLEPGDLPAGVGSNLVVLLIRLTMALTTAFWVLYVNFIRSLA